MARKTFINLAVKDLDKSIEFFTKLGFKFNPQFTDENATCMIISEESFVMLLREDFFKTFTKKKICDAAANTEVLIALSAEDRKEVDVITNQAVEAGGKIHRNPEDHGWMYGRSFEDLDGHIWEVIWMDPSQQENELPQRA